MGACSGGVVIIEQKVYTIPSLHNEVVGGRTAVKTIFRKRREGI